MLFFSKRLALLLSYVSWAFSSGITVSKSWRVWEFDSNVIPKIYIGLWETSYVQRINASGKVLELPMCAVIKDSWNIPQEIYYGQDLMVLANFMTPVTLYFGTLAVWASWIDPRYPDFFQACYNISALFLIISCVCITVTVIWNFTADICGGTTLDFPCDFLVRREMVRVKQVSYVLPVGIASAELALLSALIFSYEWYSNIQWCRQKPTPAVSKSKKED